MLKPPINRMGGKSKLRNKIIGLIPMHICYVELFLGAGWVYFGKEPSKAEVINDIDRELMNLFRMLKYHAPEVERMLEYDFSGRDIFYEYRDYTMECMTEIHRAARFLYLISQSFAGIGRTYGYSALGKPSQHIFHQGVLSKIKARLANTYVENLSFETVIEKYDRETTFFFADPPYFETAGYGSEFGENEHLLLLDKLKGIKGKFLLTINDHPKVQAWYRGFNVESVEVAYSVSRARKARKKYRELIITNY